MRPPRPSDSNGIPCPRKALYSGITTALGNQDANRCSEVEGAIVEDAEAAEADEKHCSESDARERNAEWSTNGDEHGRLHIENGTGSSFGSLNWACERWQRQHLSLSMETVEPAKLNNDKCGGRLSIIAASPKYVMALTKKGAPLDRRVSFIGPRMPKLLTNLSKSPPLVRGISSQAELMGECRARRRDEEQSICPRV